MLFEEPQLRQKQQSTKHVAPRVAVLVKALLDPAKYDNYKLWSMLGDSKVDEALVVQAAEMIDKAKWKIVEQDGDDHITFPPGKLFMMHLFGLFRRIGKKDQVMNIIKECIRPGCEEEIEAIEESYNAFNLSIHVETNNPSDKDGLLAQQYLGHPKNADKNNCWSMYVLAGFVTAIGASAVAIALVALSGTLCTAVTVSGAAIGLAGLGMFAYNAYKCSHQPTYNEDYIPTFQ